MKRIMAAFCIVTVTMAVVGCMSSKSASSSGKGGEVVGVGGRSFSEPSPYGMVRIGRGWLRMGIDTSSSCTGCVTASSVHDLLILPTVVTRPI